MTTRPDADPRLAQIAREQLVQSLITAEEDLAIVLEDEQAGERYFGSLRIADAVSRHRAHVQNLRADLAAQVGPDHVDATIEAQRQAVAERVRQFKAAASQSQQG